jgi:hypothetical protein
MLSLELVTSPSKKNLKLISSHKLLTQRRMKIKLAHMKPKVEVELQTMAIQGNLEEEPKPNLD